MKYNEDWNDEINNDGLNNSSDKNENYNSIDEKKTMRIGLEPEHKISYEKEKKEKVRTYPSYVLISLTSGIIGALIFATLFSVGGRTNPKNNKDNITIAASENMNIPEAVAEKTMDSVVGITKKEIREQESIFTGPVKQIVEGVGSGVIVSSDGYILTNSHVVGGSSGELKVLFSDGKEKEAKIIWQDKSLDLAIIKADAQGLKAAELGDSDKIKIGQSAIAIGNPLGLEFERTVTSGIVSGLNRSLEVSDNGTNMEGLIQTDASVNSGNSGGPLLDKTGKVIGINTLKIQSSEGMGFAQPINLVKSIIEEVTKNGRFEEAYIGIYGGDVLKYQQMTGKDLGVKKGTLVTSIAENSPAEKAGIEPGDVIVGINDKEIDSFQGLKKELYKYKPGEKIKLKISRNGKEKEINIILSNTENNLG